MKSILCICAFALFVTAPAGRLLAQGADPAKEIKELAKRVGEQLEEIDRLLLESSKKNQPRATPTEKLQQAKTTSEAVESGIDELIDKLNEMKNQGGGGQSEDQQQKQQDQQQQQGQQQQQQGNNQRRENQTPDFVQQPKDGQQQGQKPGEQQPGEQPGGNKPQDQQKRDGNPNGAQQSNDPGQNTTGNRQPEPETGPGQPGTGEGGWGELQDYVNFLKNRGSPPKVPEKFRKYWEAYLRNKRGSGN
ncbi:MAG: hypothetical protein H6838_05845 [Planctomycetes bacterium]|nr:hypothetical protein [Planctomycetota bacterium]MCB9884993.1 hypothetical protein [Planctomycetota bacterium]